MVETLPILGSLRPSAGVVVSFTRESRRYPSAAHESSLTTAVESVIVEGSSLLFSNRGYFCSTILFLQSFPLCGKSLLKCAPTLFSRWSAERVMSMAAVTMFLSSSASLSI